MNNLYGYSMTKKMYIPKNGHNSGMTEPIWLNIELGRDFMALSIFSKFGDDPT